MPPNGHALLSASSSDRWLHCPPSARLCETYEDKGSDYAAEGTDTGFHGCHCLCCNRICAKIHLSKLLRLKGGRLYPLFVDCRREMPTGTWLEAGIGERVDETHVKSRLGPLYLHPGFHSCEVPFTDWIGSRGPDGKLYQRSDTVWCECEVDGSEVTVTDRYGLRTIPEGWYYFRTKAGQPFPWVISKRIFIKRMLTHAEVEEICREHGVEAQKMEE